MAILLLGGVWRVRALVGRRRGQGGEPSCSRPISDPVARAAPPRSPGPARSCRTRTAKSISAWPAGREESDPSQTRLIDTAEESDRPHGARTPPRIVGPDAGVLWSGIPDRPVGGQGGGSPGCRPADTESAPSATDEGRDCAPAAAPGADHGGAPPDGSIGPRATSQHRQQGKLQAEKHDGRRAALPLEQPSSADYPQVPGHGAGWKRRGRGGDRDQACRRRSRWHRATRPRA